MQKFEMSNDYSAATAAGITEGVEKLHLDPGTGEMISKSELKRRLKQREKEASKAERLVITATAEVSSAAVAAAVDEESLDPNQYYEMQLRNLQKMKDQGINPYPHKFHVTMKVPEFVEKYNSIEAGNSLEGERVSIAGKIPFIIILFDIDACD